MSCHLRTELLNFDLKERIYLKDLHILHSYLYILVIMTKLFFKDRKTVLIVFYATQEHPTSKKIENIYM